MDVHTSLSLSLTPYYLREAKRANIKDSKFICAAQGAAAFRVWQTLSRRDQNKYHEKYIGKQIEAADDK